MRARPSGEISLRGSSEPDPAAAAAEGEEGKEPSDWTLKKRKKRFNEEIIIGISYMYMYGFFGRNTCNVITVEIVIR